MTRFFWDFYGPHAAGTAQHFRVHLDAFLRQHGLRGCETGVESSGANHHAAFCCTPAACTETIARALRPKRSQAWQETAAPDGDCA